MQKQVDNAVIENDNPYDVKDREKAYYIDVGYESDWYSRWTEEAIERYIPCKDEEIINKRSEREHLNALLEKFAYENDANVSEKDWESETTYKFFIYERKNEFPGYDVGRCKYTKNIGLIYFTSEEVAKRAITEIVIPFMDGIYD